MLRTLALLLASTSPLAADETVTIPLNGHNFTLPAGFTIELAAGPPLVDRPVTVAFDEVGHLYVADSSGSNEKLTIQLEKKPHRIVRLDPAKDGVFTTGHVFADKMMFPEGTMWHNGSLYVAAPPSIWKLTDTNGNGIADQRSEWYQGKTLGNCGNDLHGPWLGPDGWFYWTKGGFQPQKHVVRRQGDRDAGLDPVPRQAGRQPARADHGRRHGQPGRPRLHARRRTDPHEHVPRLSVERPARRPDPCRLRRRLRQGLRRRPGSAHPHQHEADAGAGAPGPRRPDRHRPLRFGRLRPGISGQHVRGPVQPPQGEPAHPDAEGGDVRIEDERLRRVGQSTTSIRPTSSWTRTAAC